MNEAKNTENERHSSKSAFSDLLSVFWRWCKWVFVGKSVFAEMVRDCSNLVEIVRFQSNCHKVYPDDRIRKSMDKLFMKRKKELTK